LQDSERLVAAIEGVLEDNTPERQREAKERQAGLREVQKQALEAQERLMGKEHPDTLSAMYNLARTLRAQGDLDAIIRLGFERERLRLHARRGDLNALLAQGAEASEFFRPFWEAIRDRLRLCFEVNRITHPILVAVTGLSKNAGVSTLAAGLAVALSEMGGRVLLVDKPLPPKRLHDMLLEFRNSDIDNIVFDMPPLDDTSSTLSMASFMDKVLLTVEEKKINSESVKRAYSLLAANADVLLVVQSRSFWRLRGGR
jgi:Mrp family chromosome partitioning ATPase